MGYLSKFLGVCAALLIVCDGGRSRGARSVEGPRSAGSDVRCKGDEESGCVDTRRALPRARPCSRARGPVSIAMVRKARATVLPVQILNPSPRNFTNCKFHKKRKDGELFWVIKNGSAGTGMVSLVPAAITEEEAWTIINYERSFCKGGEE